jgi:hypothetical protein
MQYVQRWIFLRPLGSEMLGGMLNLTTMRRCLAQK